MLMILGWNIWMYVHEKRYILQEKLINSANQNMLIKLFLIGRVYYIYMKDMPYVQKIINNH